MGNLEQMLYSKITKFPMALVHADDVLSAEDSIAIRIGDYRTTNKRVIEVVHAEGITLL